MATMLPTATPEDLEGVAVHLYRATRSMDRRVFVDADGELLIIPQQGALELADRAWPAGGRARLDRAGPARGEVPGRSCRRRSARLCRRELRASVPPARARPDRRQRPRQPARFRNAGRLVRGPRRADRGDPEISRPVCGRRRSTIRRSTSSPGTAITRRAATICRASTRSARSASTIPTRRSSPC